MRVKRLAAIAIAVGIVLAGSPAVADGGQEYFVSTRGDDTLSGRSTATPFRTIQRCADTAKPGDTCTIMGGTYRETVKPRNSGTAEAPITYRAFAGQEVTVSGADPVDQWRPVTNGDLGNLVAKDKFLAESEFADAVASGAVYQTNIALNPAMDGNQILVNGEAANEAQWPDPGADPLTPNIRYAGPGSTNIRIADSALDQPAGYWTGAKAYAMYWYIAETLNVAGSEPGAVTLHKKHCRDIVPGETRYYLYGTLKALTHPGQWFYDTGSQTLYLWAADGQQPAPGLVEAKQRTYAFDLDGISHTNVDGLRVRASSLRTGDTSTGVELSNLDVRFVSAYSSLTPDPNPVIIQGCQILTAGETTSGIIIRGQHNTIRGSTISDSAGNGVALLGQYNTATENLIYDVDSMGSYAAGITMTGNHQTVTHNTIFRVGRAGINVDWHVNGTESKYNRIAYNDISGWGRLNVDTGGYYVCCQMDMTGTVIDHNWTHDATPMPLVLPWAQSGLYLDNDSGNGAVLHNNVGWNAHNTILWNAPKPTTKITAYNNTGSVEAGLLDLSGGKQYPDLTVVNNIGAVKPNVPNTGMNLSNNVPESVDPLFVNAERRDYRLRPESPARQAAIVIPGITDGSSDPVPSAGAYQYGAPRWTAGVTRIPSIPVGITAVPSTRTVGVGEFTALDVDVAMSNGTPAAASRVQIRFEVADPRVASVDSQGRIHGVAPGMTTVSAYAIGRDGRRAMTTATIAVKPAAGGLPEGWSSTNYGTNVTGLPTAGFVSHEDGTYTIEGDGANIWDRADRFTFLHRTVPDSTDVTITTTVEECSTKPAAGGLMIRDGIGAGAKMVNLRVQEGKAFFVFRTETDQPASFYRDKTPVIPVPVKLKLVKSGNTVTGYYDAGAGWQLVASVDVTMTNPLEAGFGLYSASPRPARAVFSDLEVVPSA